MEPSSGAIRIRGSLSALIEVGAGFHPDLTGRENIFLNGAILGLSRDEIRHRFDEIVEFSGLEDFIDTPVKRYSTGMFARLGFSVAAHVNPDILIVDEVLSVGDFAFQRRCLERMTQVIEGGATVLFVSHNLRAMADLCQRSLLLDRGRTIEIGSTDRVIRTYLSETEDPLDRGSDKDLFISRLELRDANGPCSHLLSGSRVFVDVDVSSRGTFERLAVVIAVKNTDFFEVFDTSTERLGAGNFSLQNDQRVTCTFSLEMHLAPGTYYVSGWIHRYDLQKEYDHWECASTFFVSSDRDVHGVANLYPDVEFGEVQEAGLRPARVSTGRTSHQRLRIRRECGAKVARMNETSPSSRGLPRFCPCRLVLLTGSSVDRLLA
jgi:ABC-type multidrug transport system ATPase subunit